MELLIPGLILVALMVYASTRIKRSAARAFEAETVETDEFIIQKPEGFLSVIGGDPQFAFEAYSKEFGTENAEKFRLSTANVVIKNKGSLNEAAAEILNSGGEIVTDHNRMVDGINYRIIEYLITEADVGFRVFSKLAERDNKVFIFTVKSLAETTPDFSRDVEAMLDSFELK